jgi:mycothiol system anti-sigma-R factor
VFDCRQVLVELSNYLDDEVAGRLRAELEEHLAECHTCRVLVDSTRKTVQIVTECRSFELPGNLSARVMQRIRALDRESKP